MCSIPSRPSSCPTAGVTVFAPKRRSSCQWPHSRVCPSRRLWSQDGAPPLKRRFDGGKLIATSRWFHRKPVQASATLVVRSENLRRSRGCGAHLGVRVSHRSVRPKLGAPSLTARRKRPSPLASQRRAEPLPASSQRWRVAMREGRRPEGLLGEHAGAVIIAMSIKEEAGTLPGSLAESASPLATPESPPRQ